MSTKLNSGARRTAVLLSTAAVTLIAAASAAEAHVTVNPDTASQGGYSKVTFRVPNEEANQSTTAVEIDLPADRPIASVKVRPVPGWTATTNTSHLPAPVKTGDNEITEAVTKIVWTGGKIDPGQFQEFDVSLGPLPKDTDQIVFKALQTYGDGTVVRWIDVPQAGQPEPDHPAPVLHLSPAAAGTSADAHGAHGAAAAPSASPGSSDMNMDMGMDMSHMNHDSAGSTSHSDTAARSLGAAGLGVGVLGFGTALWALRRKNTPAS